ncbi:hypothetical protein PhCBS80983_g01132 [Powellomyces hirtus]|uniref:RRM domain-containing protein n=1 Tax=Powellomyces hirtus TaxID=109895 RepID=A0A507EBB3_9FUNG|nr:hypothetical protein PhCBS80983_g01132 [Powellomyces hirtus]
MSKKETKVAKTAKAAAVPVKVSKKTATKKEVKKVVAKPVVESSSSDDSSSEDEKPVKKVPAKKAAEESSSDDSSSEDEAPKKAAAAAADSDSSDSDSSSEEEAKPAVNEVKVSAKVNGKPTKAAEKLTPAKDDTDTDSSDEEEAKATVAKEDSSDDSDSDEEAEKATEKRKRDSEDEDSSSDDSSDDEEDKPAKKVKSDSDSSDSSSDEEEEEKPKKRAADSGDSKQAVKKAKTETGAVTTAESNHESSTTVFVGGLAWASTEESIKEAFAECGEITSVRIITDRETGRSKGFGYVEFTTGAAAKKACEWNGSELDGRSIKVDISTPRPADGNTGGRNNRVENPKSTPASTLFIGNLSFNVTEDLVRDTFGEHGEVVHIRLPTDRETGNPKGFGYVEFGDIDTATAALQALNGADLDGRSLRIDYAGPKPDNGGAGGFGGGRGGGRGGFGGDRGGRGGRGGFGGGRGGGRGGFGGDRGGRGGRGGARGGFRGGRGAPAFAGKKTTFNHDD